MTHTDPDVLALLALGEPAGTPADLRHLAECADCTRRLDELAVVVTAGRAAVPADRLQQPDARVWAGISATLGLSPDVSPAAAVRPGEPVPPPAAPPQSPPAGNLGREVRREERESAPVTPMASRRADRSRRSTWLAVAAGVVLIGAVGAAVVAQSLGEGQDAVVAEATLDALPDWPDASGSATVRETNGERILDVAVTRDARPDSVREVWLISSDLTKLVSVGLLASDEGTFALPQGVDLAEYTIVDVSSEPLDGNPAHSSDSIVRGALRSA